MEEIRNKFQKSTSLLLLGSITPTVKGLCEDHPSNDATYTLAYIPYFRFSPAPFVNISIYSVASTPFFTSISFVAGIASNGAC